jgi:hypothetical protein
MFKSRKDQYDHQREREDIVVMRANYLEWVQKYRERGYCIFNQDKTWVFNNMSQGKVWQEDGGEIMYKVPSGSGDRATVSHLGSAETGLLDDCLLLCDSRRQKRNTPRSAKPSHRHPSTLHRSLRTSSKVKI